MAPETIGEDTRAEVKGSWGPWATIAFTCLIVAVFVVAQTALALVFLIAGVGRSSNTSISAAAVALQADGFFVAVASILAGSAALGITIPIAWLRRVPAFGTIWRFGRSRRRRCCDGWSTRSYSPPLPTACRTWPAIQRSLIGCWMSTRQRVSCPCSFLPSWLSRLSGKKWSFAAFSSRGSGAPGSGTLAPRFWLRCAGRASICSTEWFLVGQIFVAGLLFGAARSLTRSLVVPIAMHALFSGIATLQVALLSWK